MPGTCRTRWSRGQQARARLLLDYTLQRAADLPSFAVASNEVPCTQNLTGVKGAGEAGGTDIPDAVMSAVIDTLAPLGVTSLPMPITRRKVCRTIREAEVGGY